MLSLKVVRLCTLQCESEPAQGLKIFLDATKQNLDQGKFESQSGILTQDGQFFVWITPSQVSF